MNNTLSGDCHQSQVNNRCRHIWHWDGFTYSQLERKEKPTNGVILDSKLEVFVHYSTMHVLCELQLFYVIDIVKDYEIILSPPNQFGDQRRYLADFALFDGFTSELICLIEAKGVLKDNWIEKMNLMATIYPEYASKLVIVAHAGKGNKNRKLYSALSSGLDKVYSDKILNRSQYFDYLTSTLNNRYIVNHYLDTCIKNYNQFLKLAES